MAKVRGLKNIGLMNKGEIRERQFVEKHKGKGVNITRNELHIRRKYNELKEGVHYRIDETNHIFYNEKKLLKYFKIK